jgi:hypothetical protein
MSRDILLSGLFSAVLSAVISSLFYIFFSYVIERQKLRIGLLEEFTRYYDNIFMIIVYMITYKNKGFMVMKSPVQMHEDLYTTYNNQLREMQLSSSLSVKIKISYANEPVIDLNDNLTDKTNEIIRLIRTTHQNWNTVKDAIHRSLEEELIPLRKNLEGRMIEHVRMDGIIERYIPTCYKLYRFFMMK